MEVEKLKLEISKNPGIYRFVNSINGKSYVGQAVSLRVRFKAHITNYKQNRYDTPLYRAIKNMDLKILNIIQKNPQKKLQKKKLLKINLTSQKNITFRNMILIIMGIIKLQEGIMEYQDIK